MISSMIASKKVPSYSDLVAAGNAQVYSPFFLYVTIHSASNLPIKDYTSSDPYVELFVGSNQVEKGGRSPTMFRQLNPSWEWKADPIPLLHLHSPLRVKIFDEDQGERSDFMGQVSVELKDLDKSTGETVTLTLRLRDALDLKEESSSVRLSVMLRRSENIIKVHRPLDSSAKGSRSTISCMTRDYLNQLFEFFDTPSALKHEFLNSNLLIKSNADEYQLYDLVSDAYCLWQQTQSSCSLSKLFRKSGVDEDLHMIDILGKVRKSHQLVRSTTINLHSGHCRRDQITIDNSIQLVFGSGGAMNDGERDRRPDKVTICLPHVHAVWTWVKWLRFLMAMWEGRSTSMMEWAIDQNLSIVTPGATAALYVGGICYRGILKLEFSRPFSLSCVDISTSSELYAVDLERLEALNMSVDSVQPGKQVLRISQLKIYNHNQFDRLALVRAEPTSTAMGSATTTRTTSSSASGTSSSTSSSSVSVGMKSIATKSKDKYRVTIKSAQTWSTLRYAEAENHAEGDMLDVNWHNPIDVDILDHELNPKNTCGLDVLVYRTRNETADELITSQFLPFNSIVRAVHSQVRVGSAPMQVFKTNLKAQQGSLLLAIAAHLSSLLFVCLFV